MPYGALKLSVLVLGAFARVLGALQELSASRLGGELGDDGGLGPIDLVRWYPWLWGREPPMDTGLSPPKCVTPAPPPAAELPAA